MVKKIVGILISLMMMALFAGCGSGGGGGNSGAVLVELKLAKESATTGQNSTYELPSAKAIYDNDEEKEVEVTWSPSVADTSEIGTQVYKASYTENGVTKKATFTLTVKANSKLVSIKLDSETATVALEESYTLPKTATSEYEDGTTGVVTVKWDKTVDTSIEGDTDYVASYTENGVTKKATFTLTVKAKAKLLSIKLDSERGIAALNDKTYTLPKTATAEYEDGTTGVVTVKWDKTADTSKEGDTDYVASYTENGVTKKATFTLTVKEEYIDKLKSIAFATNTVTVNKGEKVTLPTKATATYESLKNKEVTVTWASGTTVDTTAAGTKTYKATYKETYDDETTVTKTATYTVIVSEDKKVETFTIAKTSDSVEVGNSYTLPATGIITYDDATTETVKVTWDKTVSTTTAGIYTYTGSCSKTDITVTFKLTVSKIVTEPTFEISDLTGTASGYVNVKITGKNFKEVVSGADFTLEYDSKYLSLEEGESDVTFLNGFSKALKIVQNQSGKLIIAGAGESDFSVNGDIINIKFKVSTTKGTTSIKVASASTAVIIGNNQTATVITVTDKGEITIK